MIHATSGRLSSGSSVTLRAERTPPRLTVPKRAMHMEPSEFIVHDRLGPLTLRGYTLSDRRWKPRRGDGLDRRRWTDMVLYRVEDPKSPYQYALQITARSIVFHRPGGPCASPRHRIVTAAEVWKDSERCISLVPCRKPGCRPQELGLMDGQAKIAEEQDDHHLFLCTSASDILKKLYRQKGEISSLAGDVLEDAARVEPRIAQAWKTRRRV